MSDLRPAGVNTKIGEEEHNLLFTLNVIDAVQSEYDQTVGKTLSELSDWRKAPERLRFVLKELLNDEKARKGSYEAYTAVEVGSMITAAEMPELTAAVIASYAGAVPEEEETQAGQDTELLDIASMLIAATAKMGYSEEEVFRMTPRKYRVIFDKFLEMNGVKKESDYAIDGMP